MAEAKEKVPDLILKALRGSGFPFQTAVAKVTNSVNGWSILASEYPWRGTENDERFLDILATNHRFVLTIECKKTKDSLIFLRPLAADANAGDVDHFRCIYVEPHRFGRVHAACEGWNIWPRSRSCEFCVVSGNSGNSQRLLERDASLLVNATDAFAKDSYRYLRGDQARSFLILPVIVTNAKLYTAHYNPLEVSLDSGEFENWPKKIEDDVPWIRFEKNLIAGGGRDFGHRSVFVVNSLWWEKFLGALEESPDQLENKTPVTLNTGQFVSQ